MKSSNRARNFRAALLLIFASLQHNRRSRRLAAQAINKLSQKVKNNETKFIRWPEGRFRVWPGDDPTIKDSFVTPIHLSSRQAEAFVTTSDSPIESFLATTPCNSMKRISMQSSQILGLSAESSRSTLAAGVALCICTISFSHVTDVDKMRDAAMG